MEKNGSPFNVQLDGVTLALANQLDQLVVVHVEDLLAVDLDQVVQVLQASASGRGAWSNLLDSSK